MRDDLCAFGALESRGGGEVLVFGLDRDMCFAPWKGVLRYHPPSGRLSEINNGAKGTPPSLHMFVN